MELQPPSNDRTLPDYRHAETKRSYGLSDKIAEMIDNLSIDEVLRLLINESDLEEVAACLDMICRDEGKSIVLSSENGVIYPAPATISQG